MTNNITNYIIKASNLEDLIMHPGAIPIIAFVGLSALTLWSIRFTLSLFIADPQFQVPTELTEDFITQIKDLNIFTPEFLFGLTPGSANPFTSTLMAQLSSELAAGDQILYNVGIHSILGTWQPTLDTVLYELTLIIPTI